MPGPYRAHRGADHAVTVDVHAWALQGGIPAEWGNGTYNQPPFVNGTATAAPQPPPIFMAGLTELVCDNCSLSGDLPYSWFNMQSLRHISLAGNSFSGYLPSFGARRLDSLVMDRNNLTTWLQPWIAFDLPLLRKLSLAGCKITGSLPVGKRLM